LSKLAKRWYRKKRRHSGPKKVPISILMGLGAGMVGAADLAIKGNYQGAFDDLMYKYMALGKSGDRYRFDLGGIWMGLAPALMGVMAHKFLGRMINPYLKKVPWVSF
jgi:hypothetical protein